MSFGQERQPRISFLPEVKEILISLACGRIVSAQCRRSRVLQLGQRIKRRERIPPTMIQNAFEFGSSLYTVSLFQISLAANVLWPEVAIHFITARTLQQLP